MANDSPLSGNSVHLNMVRGRRWQVRAILDGRTVPDLRELLEGFPFFEDNWAADLKAWATERLAGIVDAECQGDEFAFLAKVRGGAEVRLFELTDLVEDMYPTGWSDTVEGRRLVLYEAYATGNPYRLLPLLLTGDFDRQRVLLGWSASAQRRPDCPYQAWTEGGVIAARIGKRSVDWNEVEMAGTQIPAEDRDPETAAFLQAVMEDRVEHYVPAAPAPAPVVKKGWDLTKRPEKPKVPEKPGKVVLTVPKTGNYRQRENAKSWAAVSGVSLPLVCRPKSLKPVRDQLVATYPHMTAVVDTLLTDLSAREVIRFRPTCIVGDTGLGKTSFLRMLCRLLELESVVFQMATASDNSFAGTPAQWATSGSSVPLQLVGSSGVANPVVIIDEIEKGGTGRHNGNAAEALLPFLDRRQADSIRDPALEVTVDLSAVTYLCTANELAGIPAPVKDRLRIIRIPHPEWQHVGPLVRVIMDDLAEQLGHDPRWNPPLEPDEEEVVRQCWASGSMRQLEKIVDAILRGREKYMGRA